MKKIILLILGLVLVASVAAWSAPQEESKGHVFHGAPLYRGEASNDVFSIKLDWKLADNKLVVTGNHNAKCTYTLTNYHNTTGGVAHWETDEAVVHFDGSTWHTCSSVVLVGAHNYVYQFDWHLRKDGVLEYVIVRQPPSLKQARATE